MAMILLLTLVMPVRFGQNKEVFSDNSTNKKNTDKTSTPLGCFLVKYLTDASTLKLPTPVV